MPLIFWCEFPGQVDFKKLNKLVDFKASIYFAVHWRDEFLAIKKKIKNRNISVCVWPILEKKSGYWFSGFSARKDIDRLDNFNGFNMKIDIEPPIYFGKHGLLKDIIWFLRHSIVKGKNNDYLSMKIKKLHGNLILSGFLLPSFLRKRYGDYSIGLYTGQRYSKSYICYTTFFPRFFLRLIRQIYCSIIKKMDKKNFFAIGLTNSGIFGNEPAYENINEFRKDIDMAKKAGVKNLCVYSIEGILKRKDAEKWLLPMRDFS